MKALIALLLMTTAVVAEHGRCYSKRAGWHRCTLPGGHARLEVEPAAAKQQTNVESAAPPADMVAVISKFPREPATLFFPALEVNAWPDANALPQMFSRSSVSNWPLLLDVDVNRNFTAWRDRVTGTFKLREGK